MFNLNNTRPAKYGYSPEQIEEQALDPNSGTFKKFMIFIF